jgi:hypothetical protein
MVDPQTRKVDFPQELDLPNLKTAPNRHRHFDIRRHRGLPRIRYRNGPTTRTSTPIHPLARAGRVNGKLIDSPVVEVCQKLDHLLLVDIGFQQVD